MTDSPHIAATNATVFYMSNASIQVLLRKQFVWRCVYYGSVFGVNLLLSRQMGPSASGQMFLWATQLSMVVLALGLGFDSALGYFSAAGQVRLKALCTLGFGWAAAVTVLVYVAALYLHPGMAAWLPAAYVGGTLLSTFFMQIGFGKMLSKRVNIALALPNLALLLFLCLVPLQNVGAEMAGVKLYFGSMLVQGVVVCIAVLMAKNASGPGINFLYKTFLKYAIQALVANALFLLLYRVDLLILHWLKAASAPDLGNYVQAGKMGQLIIIFPQILATVFFPQVAAGASPQGWLPSFLKLSRWFVWGCVLALPMLLLLGNYLFAFLLGPGYEHTAQLLALLLPGIAALCINTLCAGILSGLGMVRKNALGSAWALGFALPAYFVFLPLGGVWAAAAVSSAAYLVNMLYAVHQLRSRLPFAWSELYLPLALAKPKNGGPL